jgi:hypothetical protein
MYSFGLKCALISVVCAALVSAADKDKTTFQAKPVSEYPHRQTSEKVTIAASPFLTDAQTKEPFGKLNPWRLGILPVLVVIQNDGKDAIRTDRLKFVYVLPDNARVEATPAGDVKYLEGARKPSAVQGPLGGIHVSKGKSPLGEWEIEGRAFSAKMIPAGQSASGFVYFHTPDSSDAASVYISGLVNAASGNQLYYFEIPLSGK